MKKSTLSTNKQMNSLNAMQTTPPSFSSPSTASKIYNAPSAATLYLYPAHQPPSTFHLPPHNQSKLPTLPFLLRLQIPPRHKRQTPTHQYRRIKPDSKTRRIARSACTRREGRVDGFGGGIAFLLSPPQVSHLVERGCGEAMRKEEGGRRGRWEGERKSVPSASESQPTTPLISPSPHRYDPRLQRLRLRLGRRRRGGLLRRR